MLKYLKAINQSNKSIPCQVYLAKYTFLTINNWQNGILDTAPSQKAGQQREGPTQPPALSLLFPPLALTLFVP